MLIKIKHNDTDKIEEFIKLTSLYLNEVYNNFLSIEDISNLTQLNCLKTISSEIKEKRYCYYLINYENENIGFISSSQNDDVLNIYQIFALKKFRKQNIASNAIEELKKDAPNIKLFIPENNKKIKKTAEKWGFEKSGDVSRYLGYGIYVYENTYVLRVHVK